MRPGNGRVRMWGMLVWAVFAVQSVHAQVPPQPLHNVRIEVTQVTLDEATGIYWYTYRVCNPEENELSIYYMVIDIHAPPGTVVPGDWESLPHEVGFELPTWPLIPPDQPARWHTLLEHIEYRYKVQVVPVGPFSPMDANGSYVTIGSPWDLLQSPAFLLLAASDASNTSILPGQCMEGFRLASYGLPGIRTAAVHPSALLLQDQGRLPEEWLTDPGDTWEEYVWKERQIQNLGYRTETVGPVGPPADFTPQGFHGYLQELLAASAARGWLTDADLQAEAEALLEAIGQALQAEQYVRAQELLLAFIALIDGAQPQQRTEEARALLVYNARYLHDQIQGGWIPLGVQVTPLQVTRALNEEVVLQVRTVRGLYAEPDVDVQVEVERGPHAGQFWTGTTDAEGRFEVRYRGRREGIDRVVVRAGPVEEPLQAVAYVTWRGGPDLALGYVIPKRVRLPLPGGRLLVEEMTVNIGNRAVGASRTWYYLSVDAQRDATDVLIGERSVPPLDVNARDRTRVVLTLPDDLAAGDYHVIACADGPDEVAELDETNNCQPLILVVMPVMAVPPNQPPVCTQAQAEPAELWPPNHTLRDVQVVGVDDPDGDPVTVTVTAVEADEPVDVRGEGDGHTCPDATMAPLRVRAERQGAGNGRVYHIRFRAEDGRGGVCEGVVTVCVPHDRGQGATCVDDGPQHDVTTCPP